MKDTAVIRDELKNIRYGLRGIIQDAIKKVSRDKFIKKITDFAEATEYLDEGDFFGVIVEDFIDDYRLKMTPFLDETTEKIFDLLTKIENRADANSFYGLSEKVESFVKVRCPLDKFSIAPGTNDFRATKKILEGTSTDAIFPTSKDETRRYSRGNRQELAFEKGFNRANLDFYQKHFQADYVFTVIGVIKHDCYKPEKLQYLNAMVASIFIQVGNALTYTNRADLALDRFQKAVLYAKASGYTKLIELINKRVDKWREINRQIKERSEENASCYACLIYIVAVIVFYFLSC